MKYIYKDNNYRYEDCKWKENRLYCYNLETGIRIEPHETFEEMFWLIFPEGTRFGGKVDFFNKERAKDNGVLLYLKDMNSEVSREPSEARGEV